MLHVISTDKEGSGIVAAKPLTITTIDSNGADADTIEQIIGIIGAVVTWNLHLIESHAALSYLVLLDHKRTHIRAHPDIAFPVFTNAGDPIDIVSGAILVDNVVVLQNDIVFHITTEDCRFYPVVVDKPQQTPAVDNHAAEGVLANAVVVDKCLVMVVGPLVIDGVKL